jgi:malonyl-CoA O-methyltransferase
VTTLTPRAGYRLWAPSYEAETVVTALDESVVASFGIAVDGLRLLDAGCGTGRRLRRVRPALAVGADLTPEMLPHSDQSEMPGECYAAADVRALPFSSDTFDVVWCRLALGHVPDIDPAYGELARACRPGGHVLTTDFHAAAVAAGHRRTFRDAAGDVHEIEHHVHTRVAHERAARGAGLVSVGHAEGVVGPSVRAFYERAGRIAAYDAQIGLPLVLGLLFTAG